MTAALAQRLFAPWRLPPARLFEEQAKLITGHLLDGGIAGASVLGLLSAIALYALFEDAVGFLWLLASLTLNASTVLVLRRSRHWALSSRGRFLLLCAVFLSAGCVWGMLPLLILDPAQPIPLLFITSVIITHCAGTYAITSSSMPLCCSYLYPALVPLILACLLSGDSLLLGLGGVCAVYLLCMQGFAAGAQQVARESIELRFANLELVGQLREESAQRESARAEAVAANLAKSRFLAAASHDLRQPLHALGLFLEALARSGLDGRQREMLDNAVSVSGSARQMLSMLLDYSRLEAGVIEPRPRNFRVQALFGRLEQELGPLADARQLVYRCRDTSLAAHADPALVELILRNLIANAIRYTERGGVLIACRRRGDEVHLEVWDTGIGIPAEEQEAVFQEFYQVGNPERDRRKGLGLGLAIVRGLCEALGAPLTLASRPGRGSLFRIVLPAASGLIVDEPARRQDEAAPFDGVSVLVVDDDAAIRQAMAGLLRSWGCTCLTAESETQALAVCQQLPGLLIVDYRLRDRKTGAGVIEALRRRFGQVPPTLIVTGDTAPDRLREAQATGALLLHKPLESSRLHEAMRQVLGAPAPGRADAPQGCRATLLHDLPRP